MNPLLRFFTARATSARADRIAARVEYLARRQARRIRCEQVATDERMPLSLREVALRELERMQ